MQGDRVLTSYLTAPCTKNGLLRARRPRFDQLTDRLYTKQQIHPYTAAWMTLIPSSFTTTMIAMSHTNSKLFVPKHRLGFCHIWLRVEHSENFPWRSGFGFRTQIYFNLFVKAGPCRRVYEDDLPFNESRRARECWMNKPTLLRDKTRGMYRGGRRVDRHHWPRPQQWRQWTSTNISRFPL